MRIRKIAGIAICLALALLPMMGIEAQGLEAWEAHSMPVAYPHVGKVICIGDAVYVQTEAVIIQAYDGVEWTDIRITENGTTVYINYMTQIDGKLYAVSLYGDVYEFNGKEWSRIVTTKKTDTYYIYGFAKIDDTFFMIESKGDLFSHDGKDWVFDSNLIPDRPVTWSSRAYATDMASFDGKLYVATGGDGVYEYDGDVCRAVNTGLSEGSLYTSEIVIINDTMYTSTHDGVFWYDGSQWNNINCGLIDYLNSPEGMVGIGDTLYINTSGSVIMYDGVSWRDIGSGLGAHKRYVTDIAVSGGALYAGTFDGGVFMYKDGEWKETNNGFRTVPVRGRDILHGSDGTLYILGYNSQVYAYKNMRWTQLSDQKDFSVSCIYLDESGALYAGAYSGVMKYNPGSGTWAAIGGDMLSDVNSIIGLGGKMYALTYTNGIFAYDGSRWEAVSNTPLQWPTQAVSDGRTIYVNTHIDGVWAYDGAEMQRIPDIQRSEASMAWTIPSGEPTSIITFLCAGKDGLLYAGTADHGLHVYNGTSWVDMTGGLDAYVKKFIPDAVEV